MKSLMVGLLSVARVAPCAVTALVGAGGFSGRGFWCDGGHHAVDGSCNGARSCARHGAHEGSSHRGDGVPNRRARLPRDRLVASPRLRARSMRVLRARPLGAALLRRSRRTPRASGLLLCGRLLPLGGNGACSGRLPSRASGASLPLRFTRRHGHAQGGARSLRRLRNGHWDEPSLAIFTSSHHHFLRSPRRRAASTGSRLVSRPSAARPPSPRW
jgi:hypothetical protein